MTTKRFLSFLTAMLVTLVPFGAGAASATVDGTTYTVVSTAKELYDALQAGGNIFLKNDIALNLNFAQTVAVKPGTVLNGNGFSLTSSTRRTTPIFSYAAGTEVGNATCCIKNIGFGTKWAPITLAGNATLFTEESPDTCRTIYQNVDFYVKGASLTGDVVGGLYSNMTGVVSFYGCTLTADLTSSPSQNLVGGWIGQINGGDLLMTNCTTYGSIKSNALCTGAFVGQAGGGNSRYTNCTNLASVTAPENVGGLVGNVGTGAGSMYFTACKNYGDITSTGSGYNSMAGGIIGRSTNRADQGNQKLRVFYDCINYGTVTSGARAGGITGSNNDYDTAGKTNNYNYYTYGNCINCGDVSGGSYAGGIMGIASPTTYRAEITDCVNIGKITSKNGYAGNFAGMLCGGVITGGYAAGVISTKKGTDVLVPYTYGTYILQEGAHKNESWSISAPTVSGVSYIGPAATVSEGITKITDGNLSAALQNLSSLCHISFVKADAADKNSYVVTAEPMLRGLQQSVKTDGDTVELRLIAGVNSLSAFQKVGFRIKVQANGITTEVNSEGNIVYPSLDALSAANKPSLISAESLSSNYLCTATVSGIPIIGGALIEVTPYAIGNHGTEYVGSTRVISCRNGVYGIEPMMINNVLLSDYAIVYASSNTLSEQLLATRMANELAKLTGVSIPVFSDAQVCTRSARILIGKTTKTTLSVTGRTISTQKNVNEIVISGADTAQLSESITYFLDTVEKRLLAGNNSWSFARSVTVPVDDTLTLMAYNMGARDNADIKKAEWDLIVDYLPDIWTSQEPWAGFLDDFLNDYAVQPNTPFLEDPSDDDVMASDVNNKAFTGNGYYGVYWGLPRWVPGDPCTAGKASYSVILYAKDRFTIDTGRSGTFWLSTQPNVSGTNYSGSNFARCATYATLTDRNTGKTFTVVNVHLDFVPAVQTAQIEILLRELKSRVGENMPIFVTGDMNSEAHSSPIALYKENPVMPMTALDEVADRAYRAHRNIDWFFTNQPEKIDVSYYNNCFEHTFLNQLWNSSLVMGMPSDHPAIYTEFKFR